MTDKFWKKVARTIVKAGTIPFPINETMVEFLNTTLNEDQAKFILIFNKRSLNIDEIKAKTDLDDDSLNKMLHSLMDNGIIVKAPSRTTGIMVYRLMGPYPGILEYSLMRGKTDEKHKKIARLTEKLFKELGKSAQNNVESISKMFKQVPAVDRTVPVEKQIEVGTERILPYEELEKYFDEYSKEEHNIAVANCYCRHQHELIDDPCKINAPKMNCFLLDKSARYAIEYGFANPISKEKALKICREAEDHGLVHKVFHIHSDPKRGIEAICNCCKCCCGIFQMYHRGITPFHTISSYIARVNEDDCIGCGACVDKCPMEALSLEDKISLVDEDRCIGCGICSHLCPEKAISLERTGFRDVYLPLKKIQLK